MIGGDDEAKLPRRRRFPFHREGFGGVPRTDGGGGAVDVGDEVAFDLEVLHPERDVELAAYLPSAVEAVRVLGGARPHSFLAALKQNWL